MKKLPSSRSRSSLVMQAILFFFAAFSISTEIFGKVLGKAQAAPTRDASVAPPTEDARSLRDKLILIENLIANEDPELSAKILKAKSALQVMAKNLSARCGYFHTPHCEAFFAKSPHLIFGSDDYAGRESIRVFVLPMELLLGGNQRMALNSKKERFILIDLDLWLELQDQDSRFLLFMTEMARFLNLESEEERYQAAGSLLQHMQMPTGTADYTFHGIPRSSETNLMDPFRRPVTVLRQDGQIFFSFASPDNKSTDLLVFNPESHIFNQKCVANDPDSKIYLLTHLNLGLQKMRLEHCQSDFRDSYNKNRSFNLRTRSGSGLVHDCSVSY